MWSLISFRLFSMDGDFASMVELVKLHKNAYTVTHLSNSKIEEELKAKMPLLYKKYTMEPEEVSHELLLYSRLSSSPVEIPKINVVLLEPSKKGWCWNELKSRRMLEWVQAAQGSHGQNGK
ncbi:hypothetical protein Pint_12285 [Pistacia integerrima]|uniref:Uncharacterized protein n=1 Tax=Pistacia integerrima TaxID=434235 RepID=A0ACC0XJE7_9ROSI|nr:hypothetical protein Pint_12285 [Pistacia integerrima]